MGLLLICVGLASIWARNRISEVLNEIQRGSWNPWGETTPRLCVICGFGAIIVGVIMFLRLLTVVPVEVASSNLTTSPFRLDSRDGHD